MNAFDGYTSPADIYYGGTRGAWDGIFYSGSILTLDSAITVHYTDAADIKGDCAVMLEYLAKKTPFKRRISAFKCKACLIFRQINLQNLLNIRIFCGIILWKI